MITPPPTRPKSHQKLVPENEAREFDVPDDLSFADALRWIADQVEAEE